MATLQFVQNSLRGLVNRFPILAGLSSLLPGTTSEASPEVSHFQYRRTHIQLPKSFITVSQTHDGKECVCGAKRSVHGA